MLCATHVVVTLSYAIGAWLKIASRFEGAPWFRKDGICKLVSSTLR